MEKLKKDEKLQYIFLTATLQSRKFFFLFTNHKYVESFSLQNKIFKEIISFECFQILYTCVSYIYIFTYTIIEFSSWVSLKFSSKGNCFEKILNKLGKNTRGGVVGKAKKKFFCCFLV